jgi:putative endonuclease
VRRVLDRLASWLRPGAGAPARAAHGQRDPLGPAGERAAARLLKRAGYRVLGRNLRCKIGEADLLCVAPDRRTIVVVEVKCRRVGTGTNAHPPPEASVHAHKRRKLLAVTRHLVRANGWTDRPVRIDVVAVEWPRRGRPVMRHYEGAVGG